MRRDLPVVPNLQQQKTLSKTLRKQWTEADPDAYQRIRESHPKLLEATDAEVAAFPFKLSAERFHDAVAQADRAGVAELLADNPELVDQSDREGISPLHKAIINRDLELVELLIDGGADLNQPDGRARMRPIDHASTAPIPTPTVRTPPGPPRGWRRGIETKRKARIERCSSCCTAMVERTRT